MRDKRIAEKLDLGLKIAGLGLGEVDYSNNTITLDARAAHLFDLPPYTPISRDTLHGRIHPEDRIEVEREVNSLLSPESVGFISVIHRVIAGDFSVKWLSARKQVEFEGFKDNGDPKPVSGLVAIQDITEFKAAESRIQFLMGEVAHRSKNMLSVVQAIARMTAKTGDPDDFVERFSARLRALAAHQTILVDDQWASTNMAHLARFQMEPYTTGKGQRVKMSGPDIKLNEKAAQSIGMALHELATNAAKYGALSNTGGTIDLSWEITGPDETAFQILWTETGGPAVTPPTRIGFGETVIRQMAASSVSGDVKLDYDPAGVKWSLRTRLENIQP